MNKNDLRYIKTSNLIISTFLDLLRIKDFHKIKVVDICKKAMISGNTFYCHFQDKYDLLDYITSDFTVKLKEEFIESAIHKKQVVSIHDNVHICFSLVYKHRDMLQLLFKADNNNKLREQLADIFVDYPLSKFYENYNDVRKTTESSLIYVYMSTAMTGYIEYWLDNLEHIDLDMAIKHMQKMSHPIIKMYFDELKKNYRLKALVNVKD